VKPISIPKLIARVKSLLRKQPGRVAQTHLKNIRIGRIEIAPSQHIVRLDGKEIFFPRKEFEVLAYLAAHADEVVQRSKLLNAVWGSDVVVGDRTIDVHIRKVREKLGKAADYIETIKGIGYRMRNPE
jgi:two-component system alkaline phosphatase synthesis response regulator PhoP